MAYIPDEDWSAYQERRRREAAEAAARSAPTPEPFPPAWLPEPTFQSPPAPSAGPPAPVQPEWWQSIPERLGQVAGRARETFDYPFGLMKPGIPDPETLGPFRTPPPTPALIRPEEVGPGTAPPWDRRNRLSMGSMLGPVDRPAWGTKQTDYNPLGPAIAQKGIEAMERYGQEIPPQAEVAAGALMRGEVSPVSLGFGPAGPLAESVARGVGQFAGGVMAGGIEPAWQQARERWGSIPEDTVPQWLAKRAGEASVPTEMALNLLPGRKLAAATADLARAGGQGVGRAAPVVGRALRKLPIEETGELRMGRQAAAEAAPQARRLYHGTGSAFDVPDAAKFDPNGKFGPGYYLTSDPRVAGSYAEQRAVAPTRVELALSQLHQELQKGQEALLRTPNDQYLRDYVTGLKSQIATGNAGPNVRAISVPESLNLLDTTLPNIEDSALDAINAVLPEHQQVPFQVRLRNAAVNAKGQITGEAVYDALADVTNSKANANAVLQRAGFDGLEYGGDRHMPLLDDQGRAIEHQAVVVFRESLPKITNAISGTPMGSAPEVGGAVVGGLAYQDDPNLSPQENAQRRLAFMATGGLAGYGAKRLGMRSRLGGTIDDASRFLDDTIERSSQIDSRLVDLESQMSDIYARRGVAKEAGHIERPPWAPRSITNAQIEQVALDRGLHPYQPGELDALDPESLKELGSGQRSGKLKRPDQSNEALAALNKEHRELTAEKKRLAQYEGGYQAALEKPPVTAEDVPASAESLPGIPGSPEYAAGAAPEALLRPSVPPVGASIIPPKGTQGAMFGATEPGMRPEFARGPKPAGIASESDLLGGPQFESEAARAQWEREQAVARGQGEMFGAPSQGQQARTLQGMSDTEYQSLVNAAVDWQYLTVKAGGMARKSDLDAWLTSQYGLDQAAAHTISNAAETADRQFMIGRNEVTWLGKRPEPVAPATSVTPEPRRRSWNPELTPEDIAAIDDQVASRIEAKQPWEMTFSDFSKQLNAPNMGDYPSYTARSGHKYQVEQALAEGKPVPPEVLAEYPDLAAKAPGTAPVVPKAPATISAMPPPSPKATAFIDEIASAPDQGTLKEIARRAQHEGTVTHTLTTTDSIAIDRAMTARRDTLIDEAQARTAARPAPQNIPDAAAPTLQSVGSPQFATEPVKPGFVRLYRGIARPSDLAGSLAGVTDQLKGGRSFTTDLTYAEDMIAPYGGTAGQGMLLYVDVPEDVARGALGTNWGDPQHVIPAEWAKQVKELPNASSPHNIADAAAETPPLSPVAPAAGLPTVKPITVAQDKVLKPARAAVASGKSSLKVWQDDKGVLYVERATGGSGYSYSTVKPDGTVTSGMPESTKGMTLLEDSKRAQARTEAATVPVRTAPPATAARAPERGPMPAGTVPPVPPPRAPGTPPTAAPPPPSRPGFAGNIKLAKFSKELQPQIQATYDASPEKFEAARRGVRSDAQVKQDAADLIDSIGGNGQKSVNRWREGQAWNAEEILALKEVLATRTRSVLEAQKATREGGDSTANLVRLQFAMKEQAATQKAVQGVTAEAGRALRVMRQTVTGALESGDERALREILDRLGGRQSAEETAAALGKIDLSDREAVFQFIRNSQPRPSWIMEIFYNSILSSPGTHLRNTIGNTLAALATPIETAVSATLDLPLSAISRRPRARFFGEVPAEAFAAARATREGLGKALYILRNGYGWDDVAKLEVRRPQAIGGIAGAAINMSTRSLVAADAVFRSLHYSAALNAGAYRMASQAGLKGQARVARIAELLTNPPKDLLDYAGKMSRYRVYQAEPGQLAQGLTKIQNINVGINGRNIQPARFALPFVPTPINLAKYGLERSPLAILNPQLWTNIIKRDPEAADQLARWFVGSAITAAVVSYAADGKITGAAPTSAIERDRFYREGKQPYSLRIGDRWVPYNSAEPLNQPLALAAVAVDAMRNGKDFTSTLGAAVGGVAKNVVSQRYLSGVSDLINTMEDPERYAPNMGERIVISLGVPFSSLSRGIAQTIDPTIRQSEGLIEEFKAVIPGLSQELLPRLNAFGEEQRRETSPLGPAMITTAKNDPVNAELVRLDVNVGFVGDSIHNVPLNREEQQAYQQLSGAKKKEILRTVIASPIYQGLDDMVKSAILERAVQRAANAAGLEYLKRIGADEIKRRLQKVKAG